MLFVIWGQYKQDPKEKLDEVHGETIAKRISKEYREYLSENWKVWHEEVAG